MEFFTPDMLLPIMAFSLFLIGVISFSLGVFILARSTVSREVRTLAEQTSRLAEKGIAQDVAGLVGNASALLSAMNQMVLTTTGVGVFLTLLGLMLTGFATWLILQLYQVIQ